MPASRRLSPCKPTHRPTVPRRGAGRQLVRGEINLRFLRHQVHVGKDHNARDGLLGDLRAPAGFGAGVVALAFGKAQLQQELHEVHEVLAGTAEGVMVVIAPAEAEPVLAMLLHPPGAVAALPISALGFEEQLAGQVASDQAKDAVEGLVGGAGSLRRRWGTNAGASATSSRALMMFASSSRLSGAGTKPR